MYVCGSDGSLDSMGEGMVCNFDGTILVGEAAIVRMKS
jgi:hypothetical protein